MAAHLETRSVTSLEGLADVVEDRSRLEGSVSFFATFDWIEPWWEAFGQRLKLCAVTVWEANRVVGIAMLARHQGRLAQIRPSVLRLAGSGSGDSDALDVLAEKGVGGPVSAAVAGWLADTCPDDLLELGSVLPESLVATQLIPAICSSGWSVMKQSVPRLVVPLAEEFEKHLDGLSPATRALIRRRRRELLLRAELGVERASTHSEIDRMMRALFLLHTARHRTSGSPGHFEDENRRRFYELLVHRLHDRGILELWQLRSARGTVAAQLGVVDRNVYHPLQEGFDPGQGHTSPGLVLQSVIFESMIERGVRAVDFQQGREAYKYRWGAIESSYFNFRCVRPGFRGRAGALRMRWDSRIAPASWTRVPC